MDRWDSQRMILESIVSAGAMLLTLVMRGRSCLLAIGLIAGAVVACGEQDAPAPTAHKPVPAAGVTTGAPRDAGLAEQRLGRPTAVSGLANIFGAGRAEPPQPGGGGAGKSPPGWRLSNAAGRVLTVRPVSGHVNPIVGDVEDNGAAGDGLGPTDVTSYKGISGIVDRRNGMFLVGVFLTDDPAVRPRARTARRHLPRPAQAARAPPRADIRSGRREGPDLPRPSRSDASLSRVRRCVPVPGRAGLVRQQRRQAHRHRHNARPGESMTWSARSTGRAAWRLSGPSERRIPPGANQRRSRLCGGVSGVVWFRLPSRADLAACRRRVRTRPPRRGRPRRPPGTGRSSRRTRRRGHRPP